MVYGTYNELVTGANPKPTNITGGPHIVTGYFKGINWYNLIVNSDK